MIEQIGVICQDANSLGLLMGLKARLKCSAKLVPAPTGVGKSVYMTRKQAKIAKAHFRKRGVDLIVRFTDADAHRWQDVRRGEQQTFEGATGDALTCGVAVRNTEVWLSLMQAHLAGELEIPPAELSAVADPTALIKNALKRARRPDQNASDVVANLVEQAPAPAFQAMLRDTSFRRFYSDCRAEAHRANCPAPNEFSDGDA